MVGTVARTAIVARIEFLTLRSLTYFKARLSPRRKSPLFARHRSHTSVEPLQAVLMLENVECRVR